MSISVSSDIVLDVARAADPAKYRAAVDKLAESGMSHSADGAAFTDALNGLEATEATANMKLSSTEANLRQQWGPANPTTSKQAAQNFEALVLQEFVQLMLPKDSQEIFGQGTAGEIWKSMMAEQIGKEMAKAGGIGIAARLLSSGAKTAKVVRSQPDLNLLTETTGTPSS